MYFQKVVKHGNRHNVDVGNINKDDLKFVSPDETIMQEELIEANDEVLKGVARDIISIQSPQQKKDVMFQLKIINPDLNLLDFVRTYIGINEIEGVNHYLIARQAQHDWDWWKKNISAPVKKAVNKAGDWIEEKGDKIVKGVSTAAKVVGGVVAVIPGIGTAVGGALIAGGAALDKVAKNMEQAKEAIDTVDALLPESDNKTATKIVEAASRDGEVDAGKIAQTVETKVINNEIAPENAPQLIKALTDVAVATVDAKKSSEKLIAEDVAKANTASMGTLSTSNAKNMQLLLIAGVAAFLLFGKK